MVIMKPILIGFVTLCISCFVQSTYLDDLALRNFTAEKQIQVVTRLVRFDAEQIHDREWAMEDNTCKEMQTVWGKLNTNMKNDLALLMRDVQENAQHDPPPEDRQMGQCLKRAKDQIDLAVQEGVEWFNECTQLPKALQLNDEKQLKRMQNKYKLSVRYTLSKAEKCRRYNNVHAAGQLYNCLQGTIAESERQFVKTAKVVREGKCIGHFTAILNCVADVFNQTAVKKELVKHDITKCTGIAYGFKPEKEENFRVNVSNVLQRHSAYYKEMIDQYNLRLHRTFLNLNKDQVRQEAVLNTHEDKLGPYYDALKKGLIDNWSAEGKKCHDQAMIKLDSLKREEQKDYRECENSYNKQITNGINGYIQMAKEMNKKLQEAGNVALLKCFGDRPQDIFNSKSIQQCVSIADKRIDWEFDRTKKREEYLINGLKFSEILSNGKTCRELRNKKLTLDADSVLNDYSRCLYGVSGDYYVVTTPTTTTTTTRLPVTGTPTYLPDHRLTTGAIKRRLYSKAVLEDDN